MSEDFDTAAFDRARGLMRATAGEALRRGDLVTWKKVPVFRKWWQFWLPPIVRYEDRIFRWE